MSVSRPYQTAPIQSTEMPPGIPFIIGNEAAERFSFYGMRTILIVYMTQFVFDSKSAHLSDAVAKEYFHAFVAAVYFLPLLGALLSDVWLGKYRTIMALSLVYCLGHLVLALNVQDLLPGLILGLALIALGAGGIKPCVSANVGDQFGKSNAHLLERVYGWFYFSINFGSFFSTLLTPYLLQSFPSWLATVLGVTSPEGIERLNRLGPPLAFGVPGVLMFVATWVFWAGRYHFAHIPPLGFDSVARSLRGENGKALLKLVPIYVFIAIFWSLYDQTASAWVLQAKEMDRKWLGVEWLESQVQAINPLLILVLIPFFSYVGYPLINRVFRLTPLRKISIGLFLTAAAFAVSSFVQVWIDKGETPSISWQILGYVIITSAEVMVSVTGLEFSYTQAPREMRSF